MAALEGEHLNLEDSYVQGIAEDIYSACLKKDPEWVENFTVAEAMGIMLKELDRGAGITESTEVFLSRVKKLLPVLISKSTDFSFPQRLEQFFDEIIESINPNHRFDDTRRN